MKSLIIVALAVLAFAGNVLADDAPPRVPDAGSSALLLAMACAGLAAVRRTVKRS
jgi:hypothetical protein